MEILTKWLKLFETRDIAAVSGLLHPEFVFVSPVVLTPLGFDVFLRYLNAARGGETGANFRYVGQWTRPHGAALEFTSRIAGVIFNGVDLLDFDQDDRLVTQAKIMLRPARAVDATLVAMMNEARDS